LQTVLSTFRVLPTIPQTFPHFWIPHFTFGIPQFRILPMPIFVNYPYIFGKTTILTTNTNFSKKQHGLFTTRRVWLFNFGCVQSWFACSYEFEFSYIVLQQGEVWGQVKITLQKWKSYEPFHPTSLYQIAHSWVPRELG